MSALIDRGWLRDRYVQAVSATSAVAVGPPSDPTAVIASIRP